MNRIAAWLGWAVGLFIVSTECGLWAAAGLGLTIAATVVYHDAHDDNKE